MVVNVSKIESLNWSPKLGSFGEIVENIEDIEQCIKTILTTPVGSDPHRPTFASRVHRYIDYPQTTVKQFIIREVFEALLTWEPRIEVKKVRVSFDTVELGRCNIEIRWNLKSSVVEQLTIVIL